MSEVEYLLAKGALKTPTLVIYPGGGPGLHVPLLARMFPLVKFILIDPVFEKPEIKPHQQIFWIADLFDIDLFQAWVQGFRETHPEVQVLMFSDIRSSPGPKPPAPLKIDSAAEIKRKNEAVRKYKKAFEDEAQKNMKMQLDWQTRLQVPALFKFRLRYTPGETRYPKGYLAFQVFAKPTSTELRLWSEDPKKTKKYDNTLVEEQMFYFNTQYRNKNFYDLFPFFGLNYDLAKSGSIFMEYVEKARLIGKIGKKAIPVFGPIKSEMAYKTSVAVAIAGAFDDFFGRKFLVEMLMGKIPTGKK
jgi:hypothetical protein